MSFFLLLAIIGMVVWVWWRIGVRKREMDREHDERESLRRRIEQDPINLAAYESLGDNLLRARRYTQAVTSYRDALALVNDESADFKAGYQLKYKIKQIEETPVRQLPISDWLTAHKKHREVIFCGACGESNGPRRERCHTCGALLVTHGFRKAIVLSLHDKPTRNSLIETAAIIAVMIVTLRFVSFLPDDIKGLLVISTALVLSGRLIWSFVTDAAGGSLSGSPSSRLSLEGRGGWGRGVMRSYHPITMDDLERLRDIEASKRAWLFSRVPKCHRLADRVLAVALCQGAALHYVDGCNGMKDFDIWTFYAGAGVADRYPAKVRMRADFGDPKFGKTDESPQCIGRRVDLMGRSLDVGPEADPVQAIREYLRQGRTTSAKLLAEKAVIILEPSHMLGTVIWPCKPGPCPGPQRCHGDTIRPLSPL
jgi:hypothetical protein